MTERTLERAFVSHAVSVALRVRDIHPADKPALQRLHARLSPETRYRRFHGAKAKLTRGDLVYLTEVDGHRHVALVGRDDRSTPPGDFDAVARVVGPWEDDPSSAELAIVVADDAQDDGMGRDLARAALRRAQDEGYDRIVLEVQADNHRALRFFQGLGARQLRSTGPVCRLVIDAS